MDDFFERWALASRPRAQPGAVPDCCWAALARVLGDSVQVETALLGGQSGNLAVRIRSGDKRYAVKGMPLNTASTRDAERFDIEATILRAGSGLRGLPSFEGETLCHWRLLATRWEEGLTLNASHGTQILTECRQIVLELHLATIGNGSIPEIEGAIQRRIGDRMTDQTLTPPGTSRLIHGGLWPDNILVTPDGPVLLDWGSCGLADPSWDSAQLAILWSQLNLGGVSEDAPKHHTALVCRQIARVLEDSPSKQHILASQLLAEVIGD